MTHHGARSLAFLRGELSISSERNREAGKKIEELDKDSDKEVSL